MEQLELFPREVEKIHQREIHCLICADVVGELGCLSCGGLGFRLLPSRVPGYEQAWRDAEAVRRSNDGLHYLACRTCRPTTL